MQNNTSETANQLKLVVVGDGAVGKTCLLHMYANNQFPERYDATIFDNYVTKVEVDGVIYRLRLWDTAGQETLDRLRVLSYKNAHVVLICFDTNSRDSYENVTTRWALEVRHNCPDAPIILVGTKIDLRTDQNLVISMAEGNEKAKEIGALTYVECSALKCIGVKNVFDEAIAAAINFTTEGTKEVSEVKRDEGFCSLL
eukprot:TRINITY_DN3131_c1_g3_i2.p1 TRINITY_DN3131_c1_g3~~TRINITY_DN3131_c1_g3_i2.p1  ORF type:complete len:199 (-),score=58.07 TRINITY_DN3131_c1_g3_i2:62-658(-)